MPPNGQLQRVWCLTDVELREIHAALVGRREHPLDAATCAPNLGVIDDLVEEIEAEQERRAAAPAGPMRSRAEG